jgi:phosphatidylglycerol:prolipoprotein diacylglycerol transferase
VSGVPTSFHLGPLVFHTYGFGLAIAAYVCFLYARKRLAKSDFDVRPFGKYAFALIVAGLIGARLANIATNWGYYSDHPARWIAVWQGGLASFGGIALALPVGLYLQRRW